MPAALRAGRPTAAAAFFSREKETWTRPEVFFALVASSAMVARWVGASETEVALACTKAARALLAGPEGPWAFVKLKGVASLAPLLRAFEEALARLQGLPVFAASGADAEAWLEERSTGDPVGPRGVLTLLDLDDAPAEALTRWSNYVGRFIVVGRRQHSSQRDLQHLKKFLPPDAMPGFLLIG
jgi:hypothetical protein